LTSKRAMIKWVKDWDAVLLQIINALRLIYDK